MPTITNKLYPPIIGNTLPAFYQDENDDIYITIPFQNNRAISRADIYTFALKIKTITNDQTTITAYAYIDPDEDYDEGITEAYNKGEVKFKIPNQIYQIDDDSWILNIGQYYKLQLAYVKVYESPSEEKNASYIGYYSEIGISKFSWYPTVTISGLDDTTGNYHIYQYIGNYAQVVDNVNYETVPADTTEKVYEYNFILKDNEDIIKESGWLLHDSSTDENEYSSYDVWEYLNELPEEGDFTIQQQVKTNSGIFAASPEQSIIDETQVSDFATFTMDYDFDNGYVSLVCTATTIEDCYWVRTNAATGERYKIGKVVLNQVFRDFTVEQGEVYNYRIFGNNTFTSPTVNKRMDYEDIFLFDGERQLKVRLNPSIGGIHETILESKTDTIGSKYPYFFRNGNVRYRDFSLGGLISFQMDEQRLFSIYGIAGQPTRERTYTAAAADNEYLNELRETRIASGPSDLTGHNFTKERKFREEVLTWLNNGKVKLFRSPSEGILLARIMSVNMSPDQTTSRMIYTFSCQVYEAAGHEYEDLIKYKIYNLE